MENHEDNQDLEQTPDQPETEIDPSELSEEELDETSGGIIVVGGKQYSIVSKLNQIALNPQPIPPGISKFGNR